MKKRKIHFNLELLLVSILFFFVFSCSQKKKNQSINNVEFGKTADTLKNDFAQAFRIIRSEEKIQIDILDPLNQKVISQYFILQNGKKTVYSSFTAPVNRLITTSTSHNGMLKKIGLKEKIVGVSGFSFLCDILDKNEVAEVGEMGLTNPEAFVKAKPEIIFYSGFNLEDPILNKLKEAGLKTFLIYDWKETHPLGRAEWIKVFGLLSNKEQEAHSLFEKVKSDYFSIVEKLKKATSQPSVLAGTYFGDVFNVPAGQSYLAQLFKDANIDYKYATTEGTGSLSLTLEEVITTNSETEYWLNAYATSKNELLSQNNKFELMRAVRQGNLYSYTKNMNCFFENSPIMPDVLLEDLGKIFHPELFEDGHMEFYTILD